MDKVPDFGDTNSRCLKRGNVKDGHLPAAIYRLIDPDQGIAN
jgi:hypothetical protein